VSPTAEVPEAIRRYFAGVNGEAWDDFRGIWHEDAEVDVVGGMRFRGLDEIMAYYPRVLASFPVHHDDPYGIHVSGDVVTVEIAFAGETEAGVPAAWEAVDVFHLVDGRVKRLTTWYDLDEVVALLRDPGVPEKRLALLLDRAGLGSLDDAPVTREAPRPERARVVLRGGGEVSAADWAERVELWRRAIRVAGEGGATVALPSPDPSFAEAAGRERRRFAVSPDDADRTLDVLTFPATGPVAIGCGRGDGLHVLTDGHVVELAEDELLVTPLGRKVPLLRYAPGVRAAWVEGACACGSDLPRLRVLQ
jgi:uncharacterized protein